MHVRLVKGLSAELLCSRIVSFAKRFNYLPNGKMVENTKMKAVADDKINKIEKLVFVRKWKKTLWKKKKTLVTSTVFLSFNVCKMALFREVV